MNLLLVDNSNIFITAKEYYGDDCRFDYDKFAKRFVAQKSLKKVLVGSTTQNGDGFWQLMKKRGWEIHAYERNKQRGGRKGLIPNLCCVV